MNGKQKTRQNNLGMRMHFYKEKRLRNGRQKQDKTT